MQLIVRISELERQHMALLARLPPDFQQKFHARHKEAAAEPGKKPRGKGSLLYTAFNKAKALRPQHSSGRSLASVMSLKSAHTLKLVHAGAEKWVFPVPVLDEVAYRTDNGA